MVRSNAHNTCRLTRLVLVLTLALGALGLAGCGGSHIEVDYARAGNPRKEDYFIGVADVLKVSVWKMPDVNTDVRVRPDGSITVPLIGEVQAAGRTPAQLRADIQARLSKFVKDEGTIVTVAVVEVNSYSVTVSGKVQRPGLFTLKQYVTVSEAIALAGGPTIYANPEETVIVRTWRSKPPKRIPVNYNKIQQGFAPEQDLVLYTGDTVYVP